METIKNILLSGSGDRTMATDILFRVSDRPQPVVIYAHGFNGFKDWGNFDLIAARFAEAGYVFVKFNFSHNGTTPANPTEFVDLEAFGNNNYSRQLEDLQRVIDWVCDNANPYRAVMDSSRVGLVGHSMGGGIAILQAARDKRVKALITWAAISECKTPWGSWSQDKLDEWKVNGVENYVNTRTSQRMPLYYQLYEDFQENMARLDIAVAVKSLKIPLLICHGSADSSVSPGSAYQLKEWRPAAELLMVDSDHVFGRKHPWPGPGLPAAMEKVMNASLKFLNHIGHIGGT